MDSVDVAGVVCWFLMSVAFVAAGSRFWLWNGACAVLLVLSLFVCASDPRGLRSSDALALIIGLFLFWAGLLVLRAMLDRSVSLHMLLCYSHNQPDPAIEDRIAGRLDEAMRFRLVCSHSERCALSRTGVALDRVVGTLYRMFGIN
jgi:hypothetical protein